MLKAIVVAVVTFFVSIFVEALLADTFNAPGIGVMAGVSVMGGFIIYFNEKKK